MPDLFVLMQGHGHYFENQGGHAFVDKTAEYFPKTPWGAMGIKFFDFDNDGRPDLFVTDMHSDMFETMPPKREKQKAAIHPPEALLGGAPARSFSATRCSITRRNRAGPPSRRCPIAPASRTTGRGVRASGT
jgi:hypothetical protein